MLSAGRTTLRLGARGVNVRWCSSIPEESDWWLVEGVVYSVQDLRTVKKGDPGDRHSQQRVPRANHLSGQRFPEQGDQRSCWNEYMRIYERARDDWEKLVWDAPKVTHRVEDDFFDLPLLKKTKKKNLPAEKKPFSMEEIQAAIRENVRPPVSEQKIEYRTAADTKWPF